MFDYSTHTQTIITTTFSKLFHAKEQSWFQEKSFNSLAGIFSVLIKSGKHHCHGYFGQNSTEKFTNLEIYRSY